MAEGGSIINFGDLTKPATVLIEKVCNAVGVIYEPTRIKRLARAEAEADKIKALARIDLTELERRAVERLVHQEARKQDIIEQITAQAASTLPSDAKVEALDEDWIAHFFKQCDTVSDKEMQSLWARMLSNEATSPGKFSKRTVAFVSAMDKQDAALFTSFCQFAWLIGKTATPLIYDLDSDVYTKQGVNFGVLKHLDSIGLISFDPSPLSAYTQNELPKHFLIYYNVQPFAVDFPSDKYMLEIGHAILTTIGTELFPICGAVKNDAFIDYVVRNWFQQGIVVTSVMPGAIKANN